MGDLVGAAMVGMILAAVCFAVVDFAVIVVAVVWFVSRRFRREPGLRRAFLDGAADGVGDEDDLVL